MIRDEVLGVIVEAEDTVMLGGIGRLEVERVDILRILAAVAVVIDIGQHAALKSVVGVVSDRGQDTEVPTGLDLIAKRIHLHFLLFLLGIYRREAEHEGCQCEDDFFHIRRVLDMT